MSESPYLTWLCYVLRNNYQSRDKKYNHMPNGPKLIESPWELMIDLIRVFCSTVNEGCDISIIGLEVS